MGMSGHGECYEGVPTVRRRLRGVRGEVPRPSRAPVPVPESPDIPGVLDGPLCRTSLPGARKHGTSPRQGHRVRVGVRISYTSVACTGCDPRLRRCHFARGRDGTTRDPDHLGRLSRPSTPGESHRVPGPLSHSFQDSGTSLSGPSFFLHLVRPRTTPDARVRPPVPPSR